MKQTHEWSHITEPAEQCYSQWFEEFHVLKKSWEEKENIYKTLYCPIYLPFYMLFISPHGEKLLFGIISLQPEGHSLEFHIRKIYLPWIVLSFFLIFYFWTLVSMRVKFLVDFFLPHYFEHVSYLHCFQWDVSQWFCYWSLHVISLRFFFLTDCFHNFLFVLAFGSLIVICLDGYLVIFMLLRF